MKDFDALMERDLELQKKQVDIHLIWMKYHHEFMDKSSEELEKVVSKYCLLDKLLIGIGLETQENKIRYKCLNKHYKRTLRN